MTSLRALLTFGAIAFIAIGCGESADPAADLPPAEREGFRLTAEAGCQSCHGDRGQGGVGPAWLDLFGSDVELEDGTTVVADDAYLRRSILDPSADLVAGYTILMPPNDLTEDEAEAVVTYIKGR